MNTKPKLYIVPSYVAALRHYEKLIPYLEEYYDIEFLLVGGRGMKMYCDEHNIPHYPLRVRSGSSTISLNNIPFFTPIQDRLQFIRSCKAFFEKEKPAKLIVNIPSRHFYLRTLVGIAKENGVKTIALQWAFGGAENHPKHGRSYRFMHLSEYPNMIKTALLKVHKAIVVSLLRLSDKLSIGPKFEYGLFEADKFGVLTTAGRDLLLSHGCPAEKIAIVPNIDMQHMYDLKKRFDTDESFRESLYKKYNLSPEKKIILNISTTFHMPSTTKCMTNEGQIEYFKKQFEMLRNEMPDAQLVFKIHPREQDIYSEAYRSLGVQVFGKESSIEELMVMCDLYIAHPITSSSFALQALDVDALFINFSPMLFIDAVGKYFNINNILHSHEEFKEHIKMFHDGTLPKQYTPDIKSKNLIEGIQSFIGLPELKQKELIR